jgi:RimJ/RimL family protein N-acetyltransferase
MTTFGSTCAHSAPAAGKLSLADGTQITLRPMGPEDRDRLAGLFARLGPESRRSRFFLPKHELSPRELTFFTDIDHFHHEAIAAINQRDGSLVGVARYVGVTDRAGVAEVAIEVADTFQRRGIGTALASLTIHRARVNGLTLLSATTLWENRAARGLLQRHGFCVRQSRGGEIHHELKLQSSRTGGRQGRPASTAPSVGRDRTRTPRCLITQSSAPARSHSMTTSTSVPIEEGDLLEKSRGGGGNLLD